MYGLSLQLSALPYLYDIEEVESGSERDSFVNGVSELVICFLGVHKEPNVITSWLKSACPGERVASSASSPSTSSLCWSSGTSVCVIWLAEHIIRCKLPTLVRTSSCTSGSCRYGADRHVQPLSRTSCVYYVKAKNSDPEGQ